MPGDAGVVDQHVQPTFAVQDRFDSLASAARIGHVQAHREGASDPRRVLRGRRFVDVATATHAPSCASRVRNGGADAARRARHQGHALLRHAPPPARWASAHRRAASPRPSGPTTAHPESDAAVASRWRALRPASLGRESPRRRPDARARTAARPTGSGTHAARRWRAMRLTLLDLLSALASRSRTCQSGPIASRPELNGAPMTTPTPRSTHAGSSSSSTSCSMSVYRPASRKKSGSNSSRKRGIMPRGLMPTPMAPIVPAAAQVVERAPAAGEQLTHHARPSALAARDSQNPGRAR